MFVGLVNREKRIRADRQRIEDRAAEEKSWADRFKMQTDAAMNTWQIQNEVTNRQRIEAEERAAKRATAVTADERAFQMDLLTLKRAYEIINKIHLGLSELELVAEDLKKAQESISMVLNNDNDDRVLSGIFSNFCIGK